MTLRDNNPRRLIIHNALIVNEGRSFCGWLISSGGIIDAIGQGSLPTDTDTTDTEIIDACGDMLLPGAIDTHVHFREPGLTHKADISTESRAAVAGGVTSFIDMPNTRPMTVSIEALDAKMDRAAASSAANYGFFIGATGDNIDELCHVDYSRCAGVKLFLGSSTGNMLVDNPDTLRHIFTRIHALIAVHAEHEATIAANREHLRSTMGDNIPVGYHPVIRSAQACYTSTANAVALAKETDARLHVLHISTARELELFTPGATEGKRITAETCPHYLIFGGNDDYNRLGSRIKCNPAIKELTDRDALRAAVASGIIDTVATDHAPHLISEKQGTALTAASGMPMVQFSLPLMLTLADRDNCFSIEQVVRCMSHNPATLLHIDRRGFLRPGYHADLTLLRHKRHLVTDTDVISRCGWTPLSGMTLDYTVMATWVNGRRVFDISSGIDTEVRGQALLYNNV